MQCAARGNNLWMIRVYYRYLVQNDVNLFLAGCVRFKQKVTTAGLTFAKCVSHIGFGAYSAANPTSST